MTLRNKKVLITCGPTWVPFDDMRVISNRSTGEMGHTLAKDFHKAKSKVTVLEGPVFRGLTEKAIQVRPYSFYSELVDLLKKELKKKYDIIIHAAAVSDYRLKKSYRTKLRSGQKEVHLKLIPTAKIINNIKKLSPSSVLVGFKLESSTNKNHLLNKAIELIQNAHCDFVVTNSLANKYSGYIVNAEKKIVAHATSRAGLSKKLISVIGNC